MRSGAAEPTTVKEMLRAARGLVFDFDGTLVDSNPIKRKAFEACFEGFPKREEILSYCLNHHPIPRGEKFRHVIEDILAMPYTSEWERKLNQRFEELTTTQIVQAPALQGVEPFLRRAQRSHRCAVLSSTPHEILCAILRRRGWAELFYVIRGAPVVKEDWLKEFARDQSFPPPNLIFFGDTAEDAASAKEAGCGFIQVDTHFDFSRCTDALHS